MEDRVPPTARSPPIQEDEGAVWRPGWRDDGQYVSSARRSCSPGDGADRPSGRSSPPRHLRTAPCRSATVRTSPRFRPQLPGSGTAAPPPVPPPMLSGVNPTPTFSVSWGSQVHSSMAESTTMTLSTGQWRLIALFYALAIPVPDAVPLTRSAWPAGRRRHLKPRDGGTAQLLRVEQMMRPRSGLPAERRIASAVVDHWPRPWIANKAQRRVPPAIRKVT